MNTSSMRRNSQWTAVAAGLALVVAVTAYVHAQSTWSVTDRGTLGGTRSGLWSINNRGVDVGWSLVVVSALTTLIVIATA